MSLEDNLKRRKDERDRKSADRENAQKKWAEAAEKLLIGVQDKLDELVTNGLLTVEAPYEWTVESHGAGRQNRHV